MAVRRWPRSQALARGVRTSVRNNSAAYGYSVAITATFGTVNTLSGPPDVPAIFLFVAGAAVAFSAVELVASKGFGVTDHAEPEEVILLGTSINLVSISAAAGAGALAGWLLSGLFSWPLASFGATVAYLGVVGLEMALAERVEGSS